MTPKAIFISEFVALRTAAMVGGVTITDVDDALDSATRVWEWMQASPKLPDDMKPLPVVTLDELRSMAAEVDGE